MPVTRNYMKVRCVIAVSPASKRAVVPSVCFGVWIKTLLQMQVYLETEQCIVVVSESCLNLCWKYRRPGIHIIAAHFLLLKELAPCVFALPVFFLVVFLIKQLYIYICSPSAYPFDYGFRICFRMWRNIFVIITPKILCRFISVHR